MTVESSYHIILIPNNFVPLKTVSYKGDFVKVLDEKGDYYIKYRVLDSSIDGNGHGVSLDSIHKNFPSVMNKPFLDIPIDDPNAPDGEYTKQHPYNKLVNTTVQNELKASAQWTKGIVADYSFESKFEPRAQKDSGYVSIKVTDPDTRARYRKNPDTIPKEVSIAMVVYDPENEPNVKDWEVVHIAGVGKGAYKNMNPIGACVGGSECLGHLKASALKLRDGSFKVSQDKIHLKNMPDSKDSDKDKKGDALNKFKFTSKDTPKQTPSNPPSGEKGNNDNDRYLKLEDGMNKLTGLVEGLVKRNEDEDKVKRQYAIKELMPETLIGKIYPDKEAYDKAVEEKVNSNLSLAEVSEIVNSKALAIEAATLISQNPDLMENPDFAKIPSNVFVGSSQKKKELSDEERIRKMRGISSFYGNNGGIQ